MPPIRARPERPARTRDWRPDRGRPTPRPWDQTAGPRPTPRGAMIAAVLTTRHARQPTASPAQLMRALPDTRHAAPRPRPSSRTSTAASPRTQPLRPDALDRDRRHARVREREVPGLDPLVEGIVTRIPSSPAGSTTRWTAPSSEASSMPAPQLIRGSRASGPPYRLSAGAAGRRPGLSCWCDDRRLRPAERAGLVQPAARSRRRRGA